MAMASVGSLFFFARLWRRAHILTDLEFIELRYGKGLASLLRGYKAILLGVLFNCYALGAWPLKGLTKVLDVVTGWQSLSSIIFCSVLALIYSLFAGLWGVVATDFVQFILAMIGSLVLAFYSLNAVGWWSGLHQGLLDTQKFSILPQHTSGDFWNSPFTLFLMLVFIQWWSRGLEGDGIAVQRISACKNEKESFFAMLWFNIAHYALRPWPWIIVGLCSLVLLPQVTNQAGIVDHEMAYPTMIVTLLPVGVRGLIIAAFFAAFMSTVDTHLNWGSSYLVNDLYARFIKKDATASHYVFVSRIVTFLLLVGAAIVSMMTESIKDAFFLTLELFAGVGLLGTARWFWWRVNVWSEIVGMISSGFFALFLSEKIGLLLGWTSVIDGKIIVPMTPSVIINVVGTTFIWVLVTLLTKPAPEENLIAFYKKVRPFSLGWKPIVKIVGEVEKEDNFLVQLWGWVCGVTFILSTTLMIGKFVLGFWMKGFIFLLITTLSLYFLVKAISRLKWRES